MTVVPKFWATRKSLSGVFRTPTRVLGGEGRCRVGKKRLYAPTRAGGIQVQASKERLAEITSGRSLFQQGLVATCEDRKDER